MSLATPSEAVHPDIATGVAVIHANTKAHGYALFQRTRRLVEHSMPVIVLIHTIHRAGTLGCTVLGSLVNAACCTTPWPNSQYLGEATRGFYFFTKWTLDEITPGD
jgi:hypothetical protein